MSTIKDPLIQFNVCDCSRMTFLQKRHHINNSLYPVATRVRYVLRELRQNKENVADGIYDENGNFCKRQRIQRERERKRDKEMNRRRKIKYVLIKVFLCM